MSASDDRFIKAGKMILEGKLESFSQIYKLIPRTLLAKALAKNVSLFVEKKYKDPYFFRLGEVLLISELLRVPVEKIVSLMVKDIKENDGKRTFRVNPKRGPSSKLLTAAKEAQRLYESKEFSKIEICKKLSISKPTLDRYLKMTL